MSKRDSQRLGGINRYEIDYQNRRKKRIERKFAETCSVRNRFQEIADPQPTTQDRGRACPDHPGDKIQQVKNERFLQTRSFLGRFKAITLGMRFPHLNRHQLTGVTL